MNCFPSFSTQKKSQRVKARNISTSLAAEEKERYTKYMAVDYMSSEQSMSESEGANSEYGHESPDVERPKKKFSVSAHCRGEVLSSRRSCTA